jgi:hypothetical protein
MSCCVICGGPDVPGKTAESRINAAKPRLREAMRITRLLKPDCKLWRLLQLETELQLLADIIAGERAKEDGKQAQ